jgi:hypothetical protein
MIAGAHFLLYSKNPEADRAFLKTMLEFPSVDLDEGWLLFGWAACRVGCSSWRRRICATARGTSNGSYALSDVL